MLRIPVAGKTFGIICLKEATDKLTLSVTYSSRKSVPRKWKGERSWWRPYDFQGDERDVIFVGLVDALSDGVLKRHEQSRCATTV
jgi:hypothetical protein